MHGKISVEFPHEASEEKVVRAFAAAYRALPQIERARMIEAIKISFTAATYYHNSERGPRFEFHCKDSAGTKFNLWIDWQSIQRWSSDPTMEEMVEVLRTNVSADLAQHLKKAIERLGGKFVANSV